MSRGKPSASWDDLLQDPGSLGVLVRGIFQSVERDERPRFNRSPAREIVPLGIDALVDSMISSYSFEPFSEAIKPLLKPSLGAVAARSGLGKSELHGLINGTRRLTPEKIERVARGVRVSPAHFVEYREARIAGLVNDALRDDPKAHAMVYGYLSRNKC